MIATTIITEQSERSNRLNKYFVIIFLSRYQNGGRTEDLPLPEVEPENGCYDYSGDVTFTAEQAKWVFFRVQADYTVQAVTNPIFLEAE